MIKGGIHSDMNHNFEKTKESVFIGMCVFLSGMLFAQEPLIFVAEKDATAFNWEKNNTIELYHGDHITTNAMVGYGIRFRNSQEFHLFINYDDSNTTYTVPAQNFLPANTRDTFGTDIFIDYPSDRRDSNHNQALLTPLIIGDVNEMWIPSYYCDVLAGRDREKLLEYTDFNVFNDILAGNEYFWYDNTNADIQNGRAMFYNAVIKLGLGTHFAVKNIKKTSHGYNIDCVESTIDGRYPWEIFSNSTFWNEYKPGDAMTLYIYLDGDYMDIYVDGNEILLGTFVKVKREFIEQYQSLIKTNACDLTNVQWPRRADGSMDYSLPSPSTPEEVKQPEPIELYVDTYATENSRTVQNSAKKNAIPFWAWFAIIGGAVVIAGGIAVFVIKRRK